MTNRIEKLVVGLVFAWLLAHSPAMGQQWSVSGPVEQAENTYVASGDSPVVLRLDDAGADDYIVTGQLLMSKAKASVQVGLGKVAPKSVARNPSAATISGKGDCLAFNGCFKVPPKVYSIASSPLDWSVDWTVLPKLDELWVHFAFRVIGDGAELQIMLPDYQAASLTVPADRRSAWIVLRGAAVRDLSVKPLDKLPPLMLPVTIDHAVNVRLAGEGADANLGVKIDPASLPRGVKVVDGVPFCFADSADAQAIDVAKLNHLVRKVSGKDPARSYAERGFSLEVRGDQYSAVHLIAFSGRRPGTAPRLDVRVGYVQRTADEWVDQAADVPYLSDGKSDKVVSSIPVKLADGSQGYLHHIRLPMPQTGQLREYDPLAVQFTRKIEIKPDEFMKRSVEPPSGAAVLAVTMERSQVKMSYTTDERCNLFSEGQEAVFQLKLTNCSGKEVVAQAYARCGGPGLPREQNPRFLDWTVEQRVALAPGESKEVPLDVTPKARGWFACTIGVKADGRLQQVRDTTFAYLAPDTRKAMEDSPFGIWCYWNGHAITQDRDRTEKFYSIINKGGWRWTLSSPGCQYPPKDYLPAGTRNAGPSIEEQAATHRYQADKYRFKVTFAKPPMDCTSLAIGPGYGERPRYDAKGFETRVLPWIEWVKKIGMDNAYYILHESRFDGDAILANFSELLGGVPYPWKPETKALFEQQFQNVRDYCRALKRAAPDARIVLINDGPQYALEYMKAGFPADAFDVLGLEVCGYQHLPEIQPDWLTVLGDLHTNKLMQARYGYNKPVWLTESLYHSTRPGAMWLHEQGVIMVREAMICLALGVERMTSCNTTNDCANSYGKSLWGRAGVCFRDPEYNPKTSFAMYAWLTQILDQAKCVGKLKHDSTTLHALDFQKADSSHVYPFWVVAGKQKVALETQDDKAVVYDCYGNTLPAGTRNGQVVVEVTDTPIYVTGTVVSAIADRQSVELETPEGQKVATFTDAGQVKVIEAPAKVPSRISVTPVLQGKYRAAIASVDGRQALQIELLDDDDPRKLLPRYGELELAKPIALPGRPFALNVHAKGNGGWGKLVLALTDAKGHKFISLGEGNAANRGLPYVAFDGWQTMQILLPGQFKADESMRWPANNDWGAWGEVAYPLTLTKIIMLARPHILYIDEERNVANRSVYIDSLSVTEAPEGM